MDAGKLKQVRGAEEKAREILETHRRTAEDIAAQAREEADRVVATEESRVREKCESEAEAMILLAGTEALELRQEYMFDLQYLDNMVARKRVRAARFLVERLLGG